MNFKLSEKCIFRMKLSPFIALALAEDGVMPTYQSPERPESAIFFETFDTSAALDGWTQSNADKYAGGKWSIEELAQGGLSGDMGLVLKEKAKHHALVTETELFQFNRDLTIQYEVAFQVCSLVQESVNKHLLDRHRVRRRLHEAAERE